MKSFKDVRKELDSQPQRSGDEPPPPLPCNICSKKTPPATLMERGGMCQGCYDDYQRGARQNRIGLTPNRKPA